MKNNKMYIIFTILTLICFFSLAAIANGCVCSLIPVQESKDTEEADDAGDDKEEEPPEEEQPDEGEPAEVPTITLDITEGPTYSPSDGVCYYRIKANLSGNPTPDVEFSKDDSNGAWGQYIAQVNLVDPSDTYTLTVTATNSEGTATDSMNIIWQCATQTTATISQIPGGGHIIKDSFVQHYLYTMTGDTAADETFRGFLNFDISPLAGKEVISAKIEFINPEVYTDTIFGDPFSFIEKIKVESVYWGTDDIEISDYDLPGTTLGEYDTPEFTCSTDQLINALNDSIDNSRDRFQIRISHKGQQTDHDSSFDWVAYGGSYPIKFSVTYIP